MLRATIAACLSSKGATEFTGEHDDSRSSSEAAHNNDILILIILQFLFVINPCGDQVW